MAEKEATVYIIDVGASMGVKHAGRPETDLDWSMRYVWDRITSAVSTNRKTLKIGVVGLRTKETANDLSQEDESYDHVSVLHPISQLLMPDLHELREKIRPSRTEAGDAISALVIAIKMIGDHCQKQQYRRKIVLTTNGLGTMDDDGVDEIARKLVEDRIELVVLGVDFDDPEFGVKEEDKDPRKAANEQLLKDLVEKSKGVYGTMAQAIAELSIPRVKRVTPVPGFRGRLTLGDPQSEDGIIRIDVWRYPRTMVARAPSASAFVQRRANEDGAQTQSTATMASSDKDVDLALVRYNRIYQVSDDGAIGGKRDVGRDELAKGYEYGRTAVHISPSDENVTKLETHASLEVMGFVTQAAYQRYFNMSTANVMVGAKLNQRASMALSSFIHALEELESYAVARLVTKDGRGPVIVLLAPSIEADYECLLDVQLPFAEDVRPYRFPPLDRIITVSGKVLTEHRNLPNAQLKQAMSDYVDQMDLSTFGKDDEGNPTEYMAFEDTFSPVLHRIDQAVRRRAVHPSEPIPPADEILTRFSKPPDALIQKARRQLDHLMITADIKKVPPKQKGRKRDRDAVAAQPLSGLDIDELLGRARSSNKKISPNNAIPEFKQLLATARDPHAIEDAVKQLGDIITERIKHSLGDNSYSQALEALGVMREEMIAYEEPGLFNDFVTHLKILILGDQLNGDRSEMWWFIRTRKVGLITRKESDVVDVTEEEGREFLGTR